MQPDWFPPVSRWLWCPCLLHTHKGSTRVTSELRMFFTLVACILPSHLRPIVKVSNGPERGFQVRGTGKFLLQVKPNSWEGPIPEQIYQMKRSFQLLWISGTQIPAVILWGHLFVSLQKGGLKINLFQTEFEFKYNQTCCFEALIFLV